MLLTGAWRKHVTWWSLTSPADCINACMIVGPTKVMPRFLRSLLSAVDYGVSAGTSAIDERSGCIAVPPGTYDHKKASNDPTSR